MEQKQNQYMYLNNLTYIINCFSQDILKHRIESNRFWGEDLDTHQLMKTSTATKATAAAAAAVPPTTAATAKAATLPATATTPVAARDPGAVVVVEWGGCLVT